ncbi:poly(rC)-binding protein 2/3/4 [Rhodotorula toruloides]|uniref:Poly(RC)-binding protein 2/3/4 n=1 Tax=Rhodotorula toruloides TaxID=5286 RepID=A0A511K9C2_RHOTO|nr:poly(rC)-binding protein 2/3/4 [Rhodotorula toruloides]
MADSLTASNDLARKRSRSSSPSGDSAAKKANQAASAPAKLEIDDDGDNLLKDEYNGEETKVEGEGAPMNVDSSGIPAKPADPNPEQAPQDSSAAQSPAAQTITMRTLIVTQDASIIIGKQGKNINEIRDKSGAKLNITESAFGLIVRRINDEPFDVPSVPGSRAVTIRFIIPNSRMGSVIGKAGSKIKEIQEASGARLQASEAMLPGSTERVLSVSGVADAIHIAVYYVGTVLLEHPVATSNQTYRPGSDYGRPPPPSERYSSAGPPPPRGASGGNTQVQQLYIPNELVGSIIGKGGARIGEVRAASGCQIKVNNADEPAPGSSPNERLVTITGDPSGISMAVKMLYERLEREKARQTSGAL